MVLKDRARASVFLLLQMTAKKRPKAALQLAVGGSRWFLWCKWPQNEWLTSSNTAPRPPPPPPPPLLLYPPPHSPPPPPFPGLPPCHSAWVQHSVITGPGCGLLMADWTEARRIEAHRIKDHGLIEVHRIGDHRMAAYRIEDHRMEAQRIEANRIEASIIVHIKCFYWPAVNMSLIEGSYLSLHLSISFLNYLSVPLSEHACMHTSTHTHTHTHTHT